MHFKKLAAVLLVIALILFAQVPLQANGADTGKTNLTFKQLGRDNLTLRGLFGAGSVWIPFRSDWEIKSNIQVEVHYIASPLLSSERSTLTVTSDDNVLTSIKVNPDGAQHNFTVTVPAALVREDGVTLRFTSFLALPELQCRDTNNPAQWITILNTSNVTLQPALKTTPPKLTDLPRAIVVKAAYGDPVPVIFVLPDNPDVVSLTTAGQVAARIARLAKEPFTIQSVTYSTLDKAALANANVIVIGTSANQPLLAEIASATPAATSESTAASMATSASSNTPTAKKEATASATEGGMAAVTATTAATTASTESATAAIRTSQADGNADLPTPATGALIKIINSPWNPVRSVLALTAENTAGIQLAGQVFADNATFRTLKGSAQVVKDLVPKVASDQPPAWSNQVTTFKELGEGDHTISSTGATDDFYFFRYPPGWLIKKGAQLTLNVAFSPSMNPEESYVSVFVNNVPIGSLRTGKDATDHQVTMNLPLEVLNSGSEGSSQGILIRVAVANFLSTTNCVADHPDAAWTTILNTSYFSIDNAYMSVPDLQTFPYPFVSDKINAPTTIVLPAEPTSVELAKGLEMAATLGRYAPADFELRTVTSSEALQNTQGKANLIIMGSRDRQPLVDQLSGLMLTDLKSKEAIDTFKKFQLSDVGFWHEGVSPWSKERVALVISGTTQSSFVTAASALTVASPPITRPGLIAVIDNVRVPRTIISLQGQVAEAEATQAATEAVSATPTPSGQQTPVTNITVTGQSLQIIAIVSIILALVVVAIIISIVLRRPSNR
jgi:hypothetical protein